MALFPQLYKYVIAFPILKDLLIPSLVLGHCPSFLFPYLVKTEDTFIISGSSHSVNFRTHSHQAFAPLHHWNFCFKVTKDLHIACPLSNSQFSSWPISVWLTAKSPLIHFLPLSSRILYQSDFLPLSCLLFYSPLLILFKVPKIWMSVCFRFNWLSSLSIFTLSKYIIYNLYFQPRSFPWTPGSYFSTWCLHLDV